MANIFKTIDSVSLIKTLRDFGLALRQFFATKSDINAVESALTDLDNRKIEASDIPSSLPANGGNADYATSAGSVDWDGVKNKPTSFTPSSHTHTTSEITNFPTSLPANGGNADTATALTSNAGDSVNPIYFSGGKPVACTMSTGAPYGIVRSFMYGTYTSANQFFGNGTIVTIDPKGTGCISNNDTILSLGYNPTRNTQLLVPYDRDGVYYRRINDDLNYGSWKKLAFTSDIPTSLPANGGNADYATSAGNASTADSVDWSGVTNKPSSFTPSSHTHTKSEITDFPTSLPANGGNADYATSAGNAKLHNGYTIVQTNGLTSTIRNFTLGTLVRTSINYSVTNGDSFYAEIKGNTYSYAPNSCFTQIQGYIYDNTIIAYGVTHLGVLKITPITAMNIDGKLCFWFPRLGYWMGFDIRCYTGTNYAINTVTSIEDSADPGGTKRVTLTENEITSYHSGNLTSSVIGNLGTLSNNISGNAATASNVDWSGVTNRPTNVSQFTNDAGYITASNAKFGNYLPLSGGTMTGTLTLANSSVTDGDDTTELFSVYSSTGYKNGLSIFSIDNKTYINAKPYGFGTANALYLRTYNSGVVDALVLAANGDATFAGSVTASSFIGNAATASSVDWSGVTNRPTNVSQFTNDAGYITDSDAKFGNYLPLSGGTVTGQLYLTGLEEGSSDVTDNTELLTSYASNNGFSDTNATGKVYRRDAIKVYNYIKGKLDSVYSAIGHTHTKSEIVDFPASLPANGGNADTLDKLHSSAFKKTWIAHAGGTYVGWVTIAKWTVNEPNYFSPYPFMLSIYREYASPSTESYTFSITFGWDTANIVQVNGNEGTRIIEKLRIAKCSDNLTYRLEMYVNTDFTTYSNRCFCVAYGNYGDDFTFNAVDELSSDVTSTLAEITTAPNYIVGNLSGNAATASSVDWSGVTNKPSSFTPSNHTHTKSEITDFPTSLPANGGNADTLDNIDSTGFLRNYSQNYGAAISNAIDISQTLTAGVAQVHISDVEYSSILTGYDFHNKAWQLRFRPSYDDGIYFRSQGTGTTWKKLAFTSDIPTKVSQLTNDAGYVTTDTTYSTATSDTFGLVKIGYAENGKNYPVQLSNGQMYVNVPWTDTNTDTNTWRPITDSYSGTSSETSLSQKGGKSIYDALINGYAASAGNADTVDNKHASDFAAAGHTHYIGTTAVRTYSNYQSLTGINKFLFQDDGSLAIYTTDGGQDCGVEHVNIQTCFDNKDPQTHEYVNSYTSRCNLIFQPRGGQVVIGKNMDGVSNTTEYKLRIGGSTQIEASSPLLSFYDTNADSFGSTTARINFNSSYATVGYIEQIGETLRISSTGGSSNVILNTNGSDRLLVNNSGSVGIGTNSPSSKLHVVGDIYTTDGFKKEGSNDNYVLLGGGGHKAESSLSVNYAASAGSVAWDNVANKPASLPANGGNADTATNADTVDGEHLMTQVSDWNTNSLSIFKSSENSVSNAPTTNYTYGVTLRFHRDESTYHTDLVTSLYDDRLFFRRKTEAGYQTWRELIHSGNIGSQSVNYAASAGNADTVDGYHASAFATAGHTHNYAGSDSAGGAANLLKGAYTGNGGRQMPNYFGKNKIGALMMNTSINGNSQCKDFFIMDCYSGGDVGGAVAFGVNRQSLGAYIMRSAAERTSWEESAELLGTHNYTSYTVKKDGTGATGTWGINISGNADTLDGKHASDFSTAGHTHSYLPYQDTRDIDYAPFSESFKDRGLSSTHLKYNSTDGLLDGGVYHSSIYIYPWMDSSGGCAHNLAFTENGNIWLRSGTSSWGGWKKVAWASDIPTSLPANGGNADYATSAGNASTLGGRPVSDFMLKSEHAGDMYETNDEGTDYCEVVRSWEYNPNSSGTFVSRIQVPVPSVKAMAMEIAADCIKQTKPLTLLVGDKISYTWEELHWLLRCSNTENIVYTTKYATPDASFPSMEDENPDSPPTIIEISVSYSKTQDLRYVQVTVENMYGRAYYIQKQ